MQHIIIHNLNRSSENPVRARVCDSFLCRLRGFTFRRRIPFDQGLMLVQKKDSRLDASIHMMGVFTDLSVVWVNSQRVVVDVRKARRWRPLYVPREPAQYIIEMSPERWGEFDIGDKVRFEEVPA